MKQHQKEKSSKSPNLTGSPRVITITRKPPPLIDLTSDDEGEGEKHLVVKSWSLLDNLQSEPGSRVIVDVQENEWTWQNNSSLPSTSAASAPVKIVETLKEEEDIFMVDSDNEEGEDHYERVSSPQPPILIRYESEPYQSPSFQGQMPRLLTTPTMLSIQDLLGHSLFGEENDEPSPPPQKKPRGRRTTGFTDEQTSILTSAYQRCNKLKALATIELMNDTGLEKTQIQAWFLRMNRKAKKDGGTGPRINAAGNLQPLVETENVELGTTGGPRFVENPNTDVRNENPTRKGIMRRPSESASGVVDVENEDLQDEQKPVPTPEQILFKIEARKLKISLFPSPKVLEALENSQDRSSTLVDFFVNKTLGFDKKLISETIRIKEKALECVFNDGQSECIKEWRTKFIQLKKAGESKEKAERYDSADNNILSVWVPLMVYCNLLNVSLSEAVRDFTFHSRHRAFSKDTEDYTIPRVLHYYCRSTKATGRR